VITVSDYVSVTATPHASVLSQVFDPEPGIYGWSTAKGGVHFHRIAEPIRVMAATGERARWGVILDDSILSAYDTVLVHMLHDQRNSQAWEKLARAGRHRLVFDIDDVMWAPDWAPFGEHYTPERIERLMRNIRLAHVVTTPSEYIAEYLTAAGHPNVHYVPNSIPDWLLRYQMPHRDRPAIGYQGSPSHAHDIGGHFLPDLWNILSENPRWDMVFYGGGELLEDWPDRVRVEPWRPPGREYYYGLSMDIGVGPLTDTPFNWGKSGLRAIEYSALGIVPVLQAGPAYDPWIRHGKTGILVQPHERWYNVLRDVLNDPLWIAGARDAARAAAAAWTTEVRIHDWLSAWNSV
jgi:glycosyltransferase involved in cell wall biosynthesis